MAFANSKPRTVFQGVGPVKVTLAGTVYTGDLIGYSSGWVQADANAGIPAKLIAGEDGVSGGVITAFQEAVITSITGATAGGSLYLSDTAGDISETASATSKQKVGQVVSATEAYLNPHRFQESFTESYTFAAANLDAAFYVAPFRVKVLGGKGSWSTAATAATGLQLERLQGTEAPGAGDELFSADMNAAATAENVQTGSMVTSSAVYLEVGNRLSLHKESGNATGLAKGVMTVEMERA